MPEELDGETIVFAHRMFDLVGPGRTGRLPGHDARR